ALHRHGGDRARGAGPGGARRDGVQPAGRCRGVSPPRLGERGAASGARQAKRPPGRDPRRFGRARPDLAARSGGGGSMKISRIGLGVAALGVLFALGAFLPLSRAGGSDVPVMKLAPQDFQRRVPAQGNLQAVRATPINAPVGVRGPFRIGWVAPDGSRVKGGDVIIRFDPSAAEKRLIDAEDDLRETRLKMEKEKIDGLSEVRKLERDAAMARSELENARRFQKKDDGIFSRHDIIESEIDQELAQERESHAQGTRHTRERLSGTETALLQIKIRQADAKIQQAREALQALSLT